MEIKKAIKRMAAFGVGSAMVGATIMGAMAADLNDWPAPFITKDSAGKPVFDSWLVVGDTAQPADIIGITDIAISLQFQFTSDAGSSGGSSSSVAVSGDAWRVGSQADLLEIGEEFDAAVTRIGAEELAALSDGSVTNQKGSAGYEQYVLLEDGSVVFAEDTDTDLVADYVKYETNDAIMNYSLEFTSSFEADIEDSTGADAATGTFLTDFEDEDLTLLGKTYTILTARKNVASGNGIKLTLLGGDLTDTLQEGEVKTYTLNGKEYEVENAIVTDTGTIYTQLKINGVLTRKMQEDSTETLPDGTVLGVKDILPNEAGDVTGDLVRFTLGADKLFLQDTDVTNTQPDSSKFEINDESASDVSVQIEGTNGTSTFSISTIKLTFHADDEIWVPKGSSLSDNIQLDEDTAAALKSFEIDVHYAGLTDEATEEIKVVSSGDDQYNLVFTNVVGKKITVPIAHDSTSGSTGDVAFPYTSDSNNNFTLHPTATGIRKNEYFMVTDRTNNADGYTEVIQYKGADKVWNAAGTAQDNPQIKFKLLGSGETITKTISKPNANTAEAKITIGGKEYTFRNVSIAANNTRVDGNRGASSDDFPLNITGYPTDASFNQAVTQHGALITLGTNASYHPSVNYATSALQVRYNLLTSINVTMANPSNQYDSSQSTTPAADAVEYTFTTTSNNDLVQMSRNGGVATSTTHLDSNIRHGMSTYGTWVEFVSQSSKPQELTVKVPKRQRLPQVFLTSGATSSSSTTSAGGAQVIHRINVGATRLASQVGSVNPAALSNNMIVVGGPAVNAVASDLQGNPTSEQINELYSEGKATVKLFQSNDKVAMLVAGWSAVDTTRATRVVAENGGDRLKGLANGVSEVSVNTINPTPVVEVASSQ